MEKLRVGLISLGCDKNRIDSEIMLGALSDNYKIVNDPKGADVLIVNTCGFIEASKQESIDAILEMAEYKANHNCKLLIATGCLTQRYGTELLDLIPELDIILGVNDYDKLCSSIESFFEKNNKIYHLNYSNKNINNGKRVLTTGKDFAYLRIAEGCNNFCTYCAIPKIRGVFRSRKMEDIIAEAEILAEQGVQELILVAQDTTKYGIDLYGEKSLHILISKLSKIESIKWIRVLYCYAEEITDEIIGEISNNAKVCKYIDVPVQHISNRILKLMRRRGTKEQIYSNIAKMREKIPGLALRTSIIVGFPGETDEDFQELVDFVKSVRFDKLGVFKYSQEEGTEAAEMDNQIDVEIKEAREQELMIIQQSISKEINSNKIGKVYKVLVEGKKDNLWYGRNYEMSPEIDGAVFFESDKTLNTGDIISVKVTQSLEYDLIGVVYYESC